MIIFFEVNDIGADIRDLLEPLLENNKSKKINCKFPALMTSAYIITINSRNLPKLLAFSEFHYIFGKLVWISNIINILNQKC